jgi:hypothetical protein
VCFAIYYVSPLIDPTAMLFPDLHGLVLCTKWLLYYTCLAAHPVFLLQPFYLYWSPVRQWPPPPHGLPDHLPTPFWLLLWTSCFGVCNLPGDSAHVLCPLIHYLELNQVLISTSDHRWRYDSIFSVDSVFFRSRCSLFPFSNALHNYSLVNNPHGLCVVLS